MKLDNDLIKEILEEVEEKCNGLKPHTICNTEYKDNAEKFDTLVSHHKALFDDGLVDGEFIDINGPGGVVVVLDIVRRDITSKGRKALKELQNGK